ncbi:MAG TPA: CopD family protein [Gemmatimonadales bacterium]|jgi:putative copper export protein
MNPLAPAGLVDRWALFAAVLVVVGAAAFRFLVLRRASVRQATAVSGRGDALEIHTARLATMGACLGLLASVSRLPLQFSELYDNASPIFPQLTALGLHTEWGLVWGCQVLLMFSAALAYTAAARGRRGWLLAALIAVPLAATLSLSGHALGSERLTVLAVASDIVHVVGASAWLGSMILLLRSLMLVHKGFSRESDPPASVSPGILAAAIVVAYSPLALTSASLVLLSGIVASWLHLGSLAALWQSRYGLTLVVKLVAVGVMTATGAVNWRKLGPALVKSGETAPIHRSIRLEVILGVMVLLVTAVLVVTPEPGSE